MIITAILPRQSELPFPHMCKTHSNSPNKIRIKSTQNRNSRRKIFIPFDQRANNKTGELRGLAISGQGKNRCVAASRRSMVLAAGNGKAQFMLGRRKVSVLKQAEDSDDHHVARQVRIANTNGLHARPAALFVQTANRFPGCQVTVSNGQETVNGKSIMGMLTLAASCGTELMIETTGQDAHQAMDAICRLIASKFEEG